MIPSIQEFLWSVLLILIGFSLGYYYAGWVLEKKAERLDPRTRHK